MTQKDLDLQTATFLVDSPKMQRVSPPSGVAPLLQLDYTSFTSTSWRLHRRMWGCKWDTAGTLAGRFTLEVLGARKYRYIPDKDDPFRFLRANGTLVQPGPMLTDCGSVPRIAWAIPGLDPWTYAAAFLIHDWLYTQHHVGQWDGSFEDANITMGEVIYTQMTSLEAPFASPCDWFTALTIYEAVNSFVGRRVWNRSWTEEEKYLTLNP